jgi:hypothetical protein
LPDALRYKALFEPGHGDYARERDLYFKGMSVDDWIAEVRRVEAAQQRATPPPAKPGLI